MSARVTATSSLVSVIAEMLHAHGVTRIFGIPGGGSSLALIEATGKRGIDFILTRTETAAAIMAGVTGELTGTPGVVLTGIGPGASSVVNGIAYAHLEKAPVLLLTDGPASSLHQSFDQNALFRPITKSQGRLRPESGADDLQTALHMAMAKPRGPVHFDMTAADATMPAPNAAIGKRRRPSPEPGGGNPDDARALLRTSRRPLIIAGLEARHDAAPRALRELAEALGCPVLLTYKAKGVLAETSPLAAGQFTGAKAEADIFRQADLIILFGLDPVEMIPASWGYQCPVLDLTGITRPAAPIPVTCQITGPLEDSAHELRQAGAKTAWTPQTVSDLRDALATRLSLRGTGETAQSITRDIARIAPGNCRLSVDSGAHMFAALACWQATEPFGVLKSNGLSTMGFALPAAIASSLQEPEREVVAITGDGGLMMCLSELATAVEHNCRIVVVVINDAALSLIDIKQQRQQYQSRGVRYSTVDFAKLATALGCRAWRVGTGQALAPVLEKAFAHDGPALIDVSADPDGYGDQLVALRG